MWENIHQLRQHLEAAYKELRAEEASEMPNIGTLSKLQRKVRKLNVRIAKANEAAAAATELKRDRMLAKGRVKTAGRLQRKAEAYKSNLPAKPRKPLPARGPKYAEKKEAQFSHKDGYSKFMREQACIRCHHAPPSQFAHIKGVDLGGKAEDGLPLCAVCHRWQEVHKREFEAEFLEKHGITALEMAHAMRAGYLLEKENAR